MPQTLDRLLIALFLLAALAAVSCAADNAAENNGGDAELEGEQAEGADNAEAVQYDYAACADPAKVLQFPTPAWQTVAETLTGVALKPPENDAAARLLKTSRVRWYDEMPQLDGFPLLGSFFVALDQSGSSPDLSKVRLFSLLANKVSALPMEGWKAALSEAGDILMLQTRDPLPTPKAGETFILAFYDGAVSGAVPLPACGADQQAQADYVTAAKALVGAGEGQGLRLAAPFIPARQVTALSALYAQLSAASPLNVTEIKSHALADYTDDPRPDAATKALLKDPAYDGFFTLPAYQNATGYFEQDLSTGVPKVFGETQPGFVVALPAQGTPPYPVVLFQHGGGRYKEDIFLMAKPYAARGFALIGIDLPYHGHRKQKTGPQGDLAMADFNSPVKSRDNFRQAASDHMAVLTGIGVINKSLEPLTGQARTLDPANVFYAGHSMGAVSGGITGGAANVLKGTALIAGGGFYRKMLAEGMFSIPLTTVISGRPKIESALLMAMLQALLDAGDPSNHPRRLEDPALAPKDFLVWGAIGDPIMCSASNDALGLAAGGLLALPRHHAVEGMTEQAPPIQGNFSVPGGAAAAATRVLKQIEYPGMATADIHMAIFLDQRLHEAVARCYAGRLSGAGCAFTFDE